MNKPETEYRTEIDTKLLTDVVSVLEWMIADLKSKERWSKIVRDALDKPEPEEDALSYLASLRERVCTAIGNAKPNPA